MNQYELNMDYIKLVNEWYARTSTSFSFKFRIFVSYKRHNLQGMNLSYRYIPTGDLYQIYKLYYGRDIIPRQVIEDCSSILLLERYCHLIGTWFPGSVRPFVFR